MKLSALLTSAGINVGICVVLFSLYSILRKQPMFVNIYFGRRITLRRKSRFRIERFVPSPSWIVKAWETTEEEILSLCGLDCVVFIRMIIFSIKIFCVAAATCSILVLPLNYFGENNGQYSSESLEIFSIQNIQENSKWLWAHCLALQIISCSACALLYFEYKDITEMRLAYLTRTSLNPSHFTVLVRGIPWSPKEAYSDTLRNFFKKYHAASYLSHQMVYRSRTIQKLMNDAEKMYKMLTTAAAEPNFQPGLVQCGFCGGHLTSFRVLSSETDGGMIKTSSVDTGMAVTKKECSAAFVFFKTRYAAVVASRVLQSANPMSWVIELAPEPQDVYWSKLSIPYRLLWIQRIGILVATTVFMVVFVIPVALVQSLTKLELLQKTLPFLRRLLKKDYISQLVTGYLPSVVLILFLYTVPPVMMYFSAMEGSISRTRRKKSACYKILYFMIWNVFFVNIFAGSIITQLSIFSSVKDIPTTLGRAVPAQSNFFMTYVLSSGWASLACEVMQLFPLLCNLLTRLILRVKNNPSEGTLSFPYHTEIPRVLLFGLLGFTYSILAPLILPILVLYFFVAYLVYKNQILNVYVTKYETGGTYWPIAHNATIFSLVLSQVIVLGIFVLKQSPVSSGFTIPLVIGTLLFHQYCRQRFLPVFENFPAEVLIDMDRKDELLGDQEERYQGLNSAYCQFNLATRQFYDLGCKSVPEDSSNDEEPSQSQVKGSSDAKCIEIE